MLEWQRLLARHFASARLSRNKDRRPRRRGRRAGAIPAVDGRLEYSLMPVKRVKKLEGQVLVVAYGWT